MQKKHDSVWVIIDRLTKSTYFIPVRIDYSMDQLAKLYVDEIVRLHGVLLSICVRPRPKIYVQILEGIAVSLGY